MDTPVLTDEDLTVILELIALEIDNEETIRRRSHTNPSTRLISLSALEDKIETIQQGGSR